MPYSPRARVNRFRQAYKVTPARRAWARVAWGTVALMFYPDGEQTEEEPEEGVQSGAATEPGPTLRIVIKKNTSSRPMTLDLTMLTEQEVTHLRDLFHLAFSEAIPVARLRDQEAQKAYEQGDDSFTRIYRAVPQLVVRERPVGEYPEGLFDGLENVPRGDGVRLSDQRVREPSDDLADDEPGRHEPQDDGPTPDIDPSVR